MKQCCECKTDIGIMEPSMMSEDGERWHLYCYHTRADCEWLKLGEDGEPVKLTPDEIREHNAWARQNYSVPAGLASH
jgi:hypothetical protein